MRTIALDSKVRGISSVFMDEETTAELKARINMVNGPNMGHSLMTH